jgi:hypothetical protein
MAVTKTLKDNVTGKTYTFTFDQEPTEQDLNDAMSHVEQSVQSEPAAQEAPDNRTQYEKEGVLGAMFPATTKATERGGNFLSRAVAGAGDVITTIPRGVSALATGAGTLAGGGSLSDASNAAINDFSKNKSDETGALGFAQNVAYDPSTYLPAGKFAQGGKLLEKVPAAVLAAVGKLKKAPTLAKAALGAGAQGAEQGAASAAYQEAQEGTIDPGQVAAQSGLGLGLGAASTGLGGLATKAAGGIMKKAAGRNVNIELRPGQRGANLGYDPENALKYDLVGKPREIAEKSQAILNDLNAQAKEIGAESDATVNIPAVLDKARAQFSRDKNVHDYDKISSFIDGLEETYQKAFDSPDVPLADAMSLRTQVGDKAAFVGARDRGGMTADPDADWKEKIFNSIYGNLKEEIHAKGGPELQAINRQQSEIIPIRQVALRRMPIAESNLRSGLMDAGTMALGGGAAALAPGNEGDKTRNAILGGLALAGGRRAIGSKAATRLLYGLGSKLSPAVEKPLKNLNAGDYPAGQGWKPKEDQIGFEGMGDLMTKKDFQASQKLGPHEVDPEMDLSGVDIKNLPKTRDEALMDASYASGYRPETGGASDAAAMQAKLDMRRKLFGNSTGEIKMENLSAKKQVEINKYAESINNDPDTWNTLFEAGILDRPHSQTGTAMEAMQRGEEATEKIHPDNIIEWINEVTKKKDIHK